MATRIVTYDFWRVEVFRGFRGGFGQALQNLSLLTSFAQRNATIDGDLLRWEVLDLSDPRYVYGDFSKLRMAVLPKKGGVNQPATDLGLTNTEGVDELFAFLYDRNSRILVTQYNHFGASISALQKYILDKVNIGGPLFFHPVLSQQGAQMLSNMNDMRKVVYKVARPRTAALNPIATQPIDQATQQMHDYGAQTVECTISMDRTRTSLVSRTVRGLFNTFQRNGGRDAKLEKFEVTGYVNGEKESFDMIRDRMKHQESLTVATNRSIPYQARANAAMRALNSKRAELIAQFGRCCA